MLSDNNFRELDSLYFPYIKFINVSRLLKLTKIIKSNLVNIFTTFPNRSLRA
jgi:hypothetical protein